jgi:hypothetical protein
MTRQLNRLYSIWADMRARCRRQTHQAFARYGGRGIAVCDRWQTFALFLEDMGERPEGMSLDRIDNDGPYSPDNCRWASRQVQNSNRRNCILVDHGAERLTLREYCRREGLQYRHIVKRIQDRGWPVDAALTIPLGTGKHFSTRYGAQMNAAA